MAGSADRSFAPRPAVTPPKFRSSSWAQFCPYRCGVPTRAIRLVAKVTAAATAAIATVVPARALRTGTAVRPRPGSNAIRTPTLPVTEPSLVSTGPSREARAGAAGSATPSGPCTRAAARQAAGTSTASGSNAMAAKPTPRMARLTSTPGCGSARRAGPIGMSGEAATAIATATAAPASVTTATRARDRPTSRARVMPSARRIGNSVASRISWRPSSWPMMASAMSPASAANTARAMASGRMACCVAATSSDRLMTSVPTRWPR